MEFYKELESECLKTSSIISESSKISKWTDKGCALTQKLEMFMLVVLKTD